MKVKYEQPSFVIKVMKMASRRPYFGGDDSPLNPFFISLLI